MIGSLLLPLLLLQPPAPESTPPSALPRPFSFQAPLPTGYQVPEDLLRDIRAYQKRHPIPRHTAGEFTEPERTLTVEPRFPRRAAGSTGSFMVLATVRSDGRIGDPEVVRSADPSLDAYVVRLVARWKYRPATLDGKPVAAYVTISIPLAP